MRVAKLTS